jgi:ECF transporter S component (folate family)
VSKARVITFTAFMCALSVVLTRFASFRIAVAGVEGIRLGLGTLPNILAGMILGPIYGFMSGALADVVGYFLSPLGGAYMPHFTLTAALAGAIPSIVYRYLRRSSRDRNAAVSLARTITSLAFGAVVVSLGLTPFFLHSLFAMPYGALMPPRLIAVAIEVPVYAFLVRDVMTRLKSTGMYRHSE